MSPFHVILKEVVLLMLPCRQGEACGVELALAHLVLQQQ